VPATDTEEGAMELRTGISTVASVLLASAVAAASPAVGQRFDLGARGVITLADGTPANDIPGYGVFGHYRLSDRWALGAAVDLAEYDFEQPARILGLEQDPALEPIDVLAESTALSLWIERTFRRHGAPSAWYLGGGLGYATVDVPEATGPLRGGGAFHIRTAADDEGIVFAVGGFRRNLGSRLLLDLGLRAEQHLADWQLKDTVSGRRSVIDDYFAYGGSVGLAVRF
jgi:hypothetical protein